jgi:NitT/TauT family transport system substrate-binding protein
MRPRERDRARKIPLHCGDLPMLNRIGRALLTLTLTTVPLFAGSVTAETLKKITLVQMHPVIGVGEEVFLYAVPKHLGYFAAEGLDVDVQGAQNGTVSAQVLQSNNAQVGTTAPESVMTVREQGGDLVAFFGLKRNPGTVLIVLDDSPIHKLQDLKGKTIGAPSFGAGGGLALKQNLTELGITPDQYTGIASGGGPAAVAALRTGKIDALVTWDAMLGAAENTGLTLRTVDISFQDHLAGMTLATSTSFAKANPSEVAGYCRAMTKGLVFTLANRPAAIQMLWDEFPNVKPANLDDATALKNSVHIMDRFLEMALQGQPENAPLGDFLTDNWQNSHSAFTTLGMLKGSEAATDAYTPKFLADCNAFDRDAVLAQAKDWKP